MVFGCCKKKLSESNEIILVETVKNTTQYGIENVTYVESSIQKDCKQLAFKNETTTDPECEAKDICNNNTDNEGTLHETFEEDEKNISKKNNKTGVTWATTVEIKCNSEDSESVYHILPEEGQHNCMPVPTILIENVDDPFEVSVQQISEDLSNVEADAHSAEKQNHITSETEPEKTSTNTSTIDQTVQQDKVNINDQIDQLFQPIHVQETSMDIEFPEDEPTSEVRRSSETEPEVYEQNFEYRRVLLHLKNMEEHIQKLGSLIDRFDGTFVRHLHDEIEANLQCCSLNVEDVECFSYLNLQHLQQCIQEKIQKYIKILDAKSEAPKEHVRQIDVDAGTALQRVETEVKTLCKIVEEFSSEKKNIEIQEKLQKCQRELKYIEVDGNTELENHRSDINKNIEKHLDTLKEKNREA